MPESPFEAHPLPFEHRKFTRHEAFDDLARLAATVIGLGAVLYVLWPWAWELSSLFAVGFGGVIVVVTAVVLIASILEILANADFICRIDEDLFECIAPVSAKGESFSIPIVEIAAVECDHSGDPPHPWYIHDRDGRRVRLTRNYDNPVETFIAIIRELNPSVEKRHTGN